MDESEGIYKSFRVNFPNGSKLSDIEVYTKSVYVNEAKLRVGWEWGITVIEAAYVPDVSDDGRGPFFEKFSEGHRHLGFGNGIERVDATHVTDQPVVFKIGTHLKKFSG